MDENKEVTPEEAISTEETEQKLLKSGTDRLRTQHEEGVVNPIELAKALNVRPQMIYNYIRDGKIPTTESNNTQKLVIPWGDAVAFAQKYLGRKLVKQQKVEAELRGDKS